MGFYVPPPLAEAFAFSLSLETGVTLPGIHERGFPYHFPVTDSFYFYPFPRGKGSFPGERLSYCSPTNSHFLHERKIQKLDEICVCAKLGGLYEVLPCPHLSCEHPEEPQKSCW